MSCLKCVNDYFDYQLKQGFSVQEIIEAFTSPILPPQLKTCGFTEAQIRRSGQIVATRYIIKHNDIIRSEMTI